VGLHEDRLTDHALSLVPREKGGLVEFEVLDRFREKVGRVELAKEPRNGLLRIEFAGLNPEYQGKGIAPVIYSKIDGWARERHGLRLASDYSRKPQAERLWAGMAARGLARLVDDPKVGGRYYVMESARATGGPWTAGLRLIGGMR
jgi:GNAT superfamily N-acetyltransferase